ncbi:hypothetical protein BD324DRAFT_623868 [Kockovaella imperatae]|uniref:NADH dehydrogenase [ubiquinone] 1 beta subcomplex subunit 9 n=1 Tax=Kockovaella imperatae TaxID=4999 RepID=A0A1Y1UIW9_9TREE|nr:hypothetical protein BD324DRAFT_623868 [Kockovaella imperatae]ORX37932.1 hypothetical protein BD324DRAFT_623868 [Kockovaella imperatae]
MSGAVQSFSAAHRSYVKSLYKAYLVNARDWIVDRPLWRRRCVEIRAEFERNRNITDPRALAIVLEQAEQRLADLAHPSPYIHPTDPDGSKW